MSLTQRLRRAFFRRMVSSREGRAHLLSLMVAAEEGDEAGVFERLILHADDDKLRRIVERHKADEQKHAGMYRACLARIGLTPQEVPDELMIIRQIAREAGGEFAQGEAAGDASRMVTRQDVMNTYALLLAIEERGVEQFPLIGAEFRRIGDHETAEVFDRVAKDELRHTKYCRALGRRYAPDEPTWQQAVEKYRAIEARAFHRVGIAGLAHALERGLLVPGSVGRWLSRMLARAPGRFAESSPCH